MLIERGFNQAVAQTRSDSTSARQLIAALAGRRLKIEIRGTPWVAIIESTGETLKLSRPPATAPVTLVSTDASIAGAPLSLLTLAADDAQGAIRRGDVSIEGDAEIAQKFQQLAVLLKPDLEAAAARLLGRSGAHIAMRALRSALDWTRAATWTSVQNVAEYLAHESGDLVSRPEAEQFLRGVEQLREQLDRIDARVHYAEQQALNIASGSEPV